MPKNPSFSKSEVDVISAKLIQEWSKSKREFVSLDVDTYVLLFPYLEKRKVIKDQQGKPILVLVERLSSIELIKNQRNLKDGNTTSSRG